MAELTDEQVAIVEERIRLGVQHADLVNGLLDHYCCHIEEQMSSGVDFETAYANAFAAITPNGAQEIQEELFFLLTFKMQTNMKRIVLNSGIAGAAILSAGLLFKFMHWPGAGTCIVLGISLLSLLFLPSLFVMRLREETPTAAKVLRGIATLSGMLMSLSILFRVMHWPGSLELGFVAVGLMALAFLPVYFLSGKTRQDTRVSMTATSVMIIAGCGLWLTLVASPRSQRIKEERQTLAFLRSEQILKNAELQLRRAISIETINAGNGMSIYQRCQQLKSYLVEGETGYKVLDASLASKGIFLHDNWVDNYFAKQPGMLKQLTELRQMVERYNSANTTIGSVSLQPVPVTVPILNLAGDRVVDVLNDLTQMQMIVLQNEQLIAESKRKG